MSSSTNINKSQRIAMNTVILFIRMFVLTIINLYTVRLVLKGLGVIDYGIFNAVAGVVTTSAFLISILELAIQRFYSISLGKNDQETLNQIFSISIKITIFISIIIFIAFESAGLWFISHKLNIPFERLDAAYYCFHFGLAAFILTLLQIPFSSAVFSHEDMNIYALFSSIDCILKLFVALLIGKIAMDNLSFYSLGLLIVATITFINYSLYSHFKYTECKYKKVKNPELTKKILFFSLMIKDFPGEMIVNNQERVIEFIKESKAVFIAIDTPHLMEKNGEFNDVKNKPSIVIELFKKAISSLNEEKLIVLIPLKCEKYFHEKRMSEVLGRIKEVYAPLMTLLKENENMCCMVSPILTLGDVEFDDFTYENNLVKLAPDNCPDSVLYKYVGESRYTPLFCSQPLYALLSFVAAQYKRMDNGSFLDRIKNFVFNIFNNNELLFDEIVKMDKTRISNNAPLGYEVLCGGELFHYNH